jgi:hypothetical protein
MERDCSSRLFSKFYKENEKQDRSEGGWREGGMEEKEGISSPE